MNYPEYIWHNGAVKNWKDATVHVMAHGLHYGSSVFEGIRAYKTPQGAKIFRLTDHLKRLYHSAKIYEMAIPYDLATLTQACRDVVAKKPIAANPAAPARATSGTVDAVTPPIASTGSVTLLHTAASRSTPAAAAPGFDAEGHTVPNNR